MGDSEVLEGGTMKSSEFDFAAALKRQFERAQRTKDSHPYFLLTRGPAPKCPIHGNDENLVLSVDHPYWKTFQPRSIPECKCGIRQVSFIEFERLLSDGYQDPDAPPIRDDKGRMTGHREKRNIPIKLSPSGWSEMGGGCS